jgi:hypothetical protein
VSISRLHTGMPFPAAIAYQTKRSYSRAQSVARYRPDSSTTIRIHFSHSNEVPNSAWPRASRVRCACHFFAHLDPSPKLPLLLQIAYYHSSPGLSSACILTQGAVCASWLPGICDATTASASAVTQFDFVTTPVTASTITILSGHQF